MKLNLPLLKEKLSGLLEQSTSVNEGSDRNKKIELQKDLSLFQEIIDLLESLASIEKEIEANEADLSTNDDREMHELIKEELESLKEKKSILESEIEDFVVVKDPRDEKSCFIEIRAGAGGQEAAIFASELMRVYKIYAEKNHWEISINSESETDLGGLRETILFFKGKSVYKKMKFESGVHRVQRVPVTETAGRIHTSTVTVAVMPEADEVDVKIEPNDLRIDVYRSTGAGGQHVNTTDSAVRITHIPTGIVVACQEERSQIKNRAKAMKELRSRILEAEVTKAEQERSSDRKNQIGSGDRSEKIRTYNFPQNRVTDHRIDLTLKNLDFVMKGNLEDITDALTKENDASKKIEPKLEPFILEN